jgi:hypothetical protein
MESLQFQKAEYADQRRKCAICTSAIDGSYFQLSGQTICPVCAEKAGTRLNRPTNSVVLRGLLYGAGAAVGCSVCYAIITTVTGLELAIAAIAVGYLIGRAVRIGTNGLGGRRCQIIAVVLTYLSITTSYLPLLIKGMRDEVHNQAGATAGAAKGPQASSQQAQAKAPEIQTEEIRKRPSVGTLFLGVAFLIGIALISPFLGLMSGAGGIIGIAIIAFGLLQAWKQTARPPLVLAGPFTLEENPSAG